MAVSLPSAGGKRELNSDINLVPFIDLLSVCICFLLIAAVWLQLPMPVTLAVITMSGISWARHHENIGRLLTGQESRIGKK